MERTARESCFCARQYRDVTRMLRNAFSGTVGSTTYGVAKDVALIAVKVSGIEKKKTDKKTGDDQYVNSILLPRDLV
jgi:hypothetical protein